MDGKEPSDRGVRKVSRKERALVQGRITGDVYIAFAPTKDKKVKNIKRKAADATFSFWLQHLSGKDDSSTLLQFFHP